MFERNELPGAVLRHVYAHSLDGIERGITGAYTSEHAGLAVAGWLAEFRIRSFAVDVEIVTGREVHLRPASRILRWLRRGGVAVLDVYDTPAATHSILALAAHAGHLDFWDPYIRSRRYDYGHGSSRLASDGHSPNLRLAKSWLDSPRERRYCLGPIAQRSGVLIRRTRRGRRARAAG